MPRIAVVGAGPAGLVAARFLAGVGMEPVLFEQGECVGGQWTGDPRYSAIWPSMRTNSSRLMTCFSDLPHPENAPTYLANRAVAAYLKRYAEHFGITSRVCLKTIVQRIDRDPAGRGWRVSFRAADGAQRQEVFEKVAVASGRFRKPAMPAVPGLNSFSGSGGVLHTFHYRQPGDHSGRRVLVAGCSISALEIASDLAMHDAAEVILTHRRQRYVVPKLLGGVPVEHVLFTRYAALAEETFPKETLARKLQDYILRMCGSPEHFGAPRPAEDFREAGITLCQYFLPLVAEGRIHVKPWIREIEGKTIRFADGTEEQIDTLIFGTGYQLDLPFLSAELRSALDVDARHIDLYRSTFHPDLPGLAFLGMLDLTGPYFTVLELQARWLAYAWSGSRHLPADEEMKAEIAGRRARRGGPQSIPLHSAALMFARAAGVEPDLDSWPGLARALLFGPLTPVSFRLSGQDLLPEAPQRVARDALAFGALPGTRFTPEQLSELHNLASARHDAASGIFLKRLTAGGGN